MKRNSARGPGRGVLLALAAALFACGAFPARAAGPQGKIGFVDVEAVFERYQKTKDLNERLEQERKEKISRRKEMVEEINKLKDEADLLRDEAKKKKEDLVDEKVKELYQFEEKVKREAVKRQARLQDEILEEIKKVIEGIGRKGGYDALFPFTPDDIGYHSGKLDITEQVIQRLNDEYRKGK